MSNNQNKLPLFNALQNHMNKNPQSFHVPGHKNGMIFPEEGKNAFEAILKYDLTEITGLDDLHHPEGVIKEAQELTAKLYRVDFSYFLVGGSTAGNLAMILSVCQEGDYVIVQRNSHKSVINALELVGAHPIFITPYYEEETNRYSSITKEQVREAIIQYPNAKAIVLTYPDYFGRTYDLEGIIDVAHQFHIPVLVDEAHGPHFILGEPFPTSATLLGADIVVQSAHKMLPAMTMSSFLHRKGQLVSKEKLEYYLMLLQSSSPSYPLMASLDLARYYLSQINSKQISNILDRVKNIKMILSNCSAWAVLPSERFIDDPLKITLQIKPQFDAKKIASLLEEYNIFSELSTGNQVLLVHGLGSYIDENNLTEAIISMEKKLKKSVRHDRIEISPISIQSVNCLAYSYAEMKKRKSIWVPWNQAVGGISGETVTPYPPGIPFLLRGEEITNYHIEAIKDFINRGQHIHYNGKDLEGGINVLE